MSYLDRVRACNRYDLTGFRPFRAGGVELGWVSHEFAGVLADWPSVFRVRPDAVDLDPALVGFEERSAAVAQVVDALVGEGAIARHHGEAYPVTASGRDQALFVLDRGAAAYFGIRAFGQHLNGYVRRDDGLWMWVGRRAEHRWNAPGRLDNLVAGGLPHGVSLEANLRKEAWEEAAIPAALAGRAVPVGAVSYRTASKYGLRTDALYCYDLELPPGFVPRCTDGETESFMLWPVERVAAVVRETEEFKRNCNLVVIDFLIRHGLIPPDDPDYLDLIAGLHR
jgi:8-oxo-dGTP pyrophosphatase MutT (NUDIX family)